MFAEQAELHRYTRYVVEHFGLRDRVELQAKVEHVEWDDESKRWAVTRPARAPSMRSS
jgi:cation diffusion facilitator CzcD-associated flavoprotein CzcO